MMQGDRFTMYSGDMPITRKATEAATKKRVHGKHTRWAIEMRAAGWMVISPETMKAPDGVWLDAIAAELRERGWLVAAPTELVREGVERWDIGRAAEALQAAGWEVNRPEEIRTEG